MKGRMMRACERLKQTRGCRLIVGINTTYRYGKRPGKADTESELLKYHRIGYEVR